MFVGRVATLRNDQSQPTLTRASCSGHRPEMEGYRTSTGCLCWILFILFRYVDNQCLENVPFKDMKMTWRFSGDHLLVEVDTQLRKLGIIPTIRRSPAGATFDSAQKPYLAGWWGVVPQVMQMLIWGVYFKKRTSLSFESYGFFKRFMTYPQSCVLQYFTTV